MKYRVPVAPALIEQWMRTGAEVPACRCVAGVPRAARLVWAGVDPPGCWYNHNPIILVFDDFQGDGSECEIITPVYKTIPRDVEAA